MPLTVALESKIKRILDYKRFAMVTMSSAISWPLLVSEKLLKSQRLWSITLFSMIYHVLEPGFGWHTRSCLRIFILNFGISEATPQNGLPLDIDMEETLPATESQVAASLGTPTASKGEPSPTSPSTSELTSVSKGSDDVLWLSLVIVEIVYIIVWCRNVS